MASSYPAFCKAFSKNYEIPYSKCLSQCQGAYSEYKKELDLYQAELIKKHQPKKVIAQQPQKKIKKKVVYVSSSDSDSSSEDEEARLKQRLRELKKKRRNK